MKTHEESKIFLLTAIVIILLMSFGFLYILFLINNPPIDNPQEDTGVDIYQLQLNDKLGVSADDYHNRDFYTQDQFESDKNQIARYLQVNRYDMIEEKCKTLLSTYQFEEDHLILIYALSNATVFENQSGLNSKDKIIYISMIQDPTIYLHLFNKLNFDEQKQLIRYDEINILPCFNYDDIQISIKTSDMNSIIYKRSGFTEYYEAILTYKNEQYVVSLIYDDMLWIVDINNINGDLNHSKY